MTGRPATGDVVISVVAAAVATALVVLGWVDAVHAYLLAAVVVAVTIGWRRASGGSEAEWVHPPEERREGARHDVSELGWATFTRSGTVSGRVVRRVRALAETRLALHGVDLGDPAQRPEAERLLGPAVVDGLLALRGPDPKTLHTWLDAIERLEPTDERQSR